MFVGSLFRVRTDWQICKGGLKIIHALLLERWSRSFNPVPELCHRNCRDLKFFIWMLRQPGVQVEQLLLAAYDYVRIKDYSHLSSGGVSFDRAAEMSLRQARASLAVK